MSTPLPTQLRVLRSIAEVGRDAWDALLDDEATPFLRWHWLEALESSGCTGEGTGWHPHHLTLWRGSRLIAAAPAYLKDDSHGEFVFDWSWATAAERVGVSYYPKLVLAVPYTPASGRRVLVAPAEDRETRTKELYRLALDLARASSLSSVHVLFPTAEEAAWLGEVGWAIRLGVQYHWRSAGEQCEADFLARFTSRRRGQLRREMRAVAEQGIELAVLRGEGLREITGETLFQLYASTVDRHPFGQRYLTPGFFSRLLATCPEILELVEARREGVRIAGALNVASPSVLYGRYWGSFEDFPFLHFNVCLYEGVRQAIERGLTRFEPGAGGEHKLTRGFLPEITFSAHQVFHPALDQAVRTFLAHERAAIHQGLPQWRAETGLRDARARRMS